MASCIRSIQSTLNNLNRIKLNCHRSLATSINQLKGIHTPSNKNKESFVSSCNYYANNNVSNRIFSSTITTGCKLLPSSTNNYHHYNTIVGVNPFMERRGFKSSTVHRDIFKVQDEDDFKEKVLQSKIPVIVDFYATWCGPCKLLTPRLETIVGGKKGTVNLAMVDIDEQENLAIKYNVSSIPSVMVFKDGKVLDSFLGLKDEDQIRTFVEKAASDP